MAIPRSQINSILEFHRTHPAKTNGRFGNLPIDLRDLEKWAEDDFNVVENEDYAIDYEEIRDGQLGYLQDTLETLVAHQNDLAEVIKELTGKHNLVANAVTRNTDSIAQMAHGVLEVLGRRAPQTPPKKNATKKAAKTPARKRTRKRAK